MNQDKEDDVAVGAAKYREPAALGTHAPSFSEPKKPYRDAPPERLLNEKEWPRWSFWRAGIAEFLSSLLFLYITIQTVMGSKRKDDPCLGVGSQGIAWAFGGMIFVLVYCTAGISGGHINPAITFALFLARKVSFNRALYYIVCQCLGAICGAGIVKGFQPNFYQTAGGGANSVKHGYTKGDGLGAEIVGTFVLVYVVFAATDAKRKARDSHVPALVPLPIGFAVYLVHLATIPITGTGINPARSLGAAVIFNTQHNAWADQWIFWVGPLTGAALAAGYYQLVIRALPFRKRRTPEQTSVSNSAQASGQNPAATSVQNSAQASVQNPAATSVQNSAQTAAQASALNSAQNSTQTSAQTAAEASAQNSAQNSEQTSTQTWERTWEQPSEQTSTQTWERTWEESSEPSSRHYKRQYSVEML